MQNTLNIGKKIKIAREFRHMTRSQLADAIGESYAEIRRWEETYREPHLIILKKIAVALNLDFRFFLEEDEQKGIEYFVYDPKNPLYRDYGGKKIKIQQCLNKVKSPTNLYEMERVLISLIDPNGLDEAVKRIEEIYYKDEAENTSSKRFMNAKMHNE